MAGVVGAVSVVVGLYIASVQNTRNRIANETSFVSMQLSIKYWNNNKRLMLNYMYWVKLINNGDTVSCSSIKVLITIRAIFR